MDKTDLWSKLAALLPAGAVSWRQDGKPTTRDGKWFARFVAYIEANTVRERLDSCCPGEWDLTIDLLPPIGTGEADSICSFKARLQILGVIREDVGTGKDYKQAATDAFKRAAVRFGIGHELYAYEQNWVQVDGDGRYAKPLEDPQAAYDRRYGAGTGTSTGGVDPRTERRADVASRNVAAADAENQQRVSDAAGEDVACPKCGGKTWDNRATKKNPKAPNFKCRDRTCDGVIWPEKEAKPAAKNGTRKEAISAGGPIAGLDGGEEFEDFPAALDGDDIPF